MHGMIRFTRISRCAKLAELPCHKVPAVFQARFVGSAAPGPEPSSEQISSNSAVSAVSAAEPAAETEKGADTPHSQIGAMQPEDITTPWYLRDDITSSLAAEKKVELPEIPASAPPHVREFLHLLAEDYGMDHMRLFDMARLDETHEFKANNMGVDFIIIATGKSERHILKAATAFRTHIKHTHHVLPATEGIVSTAKSPAMRRKLLRRARKGPSATDNEYGRSANSWVLFHHENVDVHIMTAERRQDLNLEALWCRPEDAHLYEHKPLAPVETDHIFGARGLHTSARRWSGTENTAHADPRAFLHTLLSLPETAHGSVFIDLKASFDAGFCGTSLESYRTKYDFYRAMHVTIPELVSLDDAESALLEKYTSSHVPANDATSVKTSDVTAYAKLLLDSPARSASMDGADSALDRLSKFISVLYQFSPEHFSMSADPEFVPLLWRLAHWENAGNSGSGSVTQKDIHSFIESRGESRKASSGSVTLASNNARNVLTLVDFHNTCEKTPVAPMGELVLYTYGNAGKWPDFWAQWDSLFFPETPSPSEALARFVRLAVFLSMVANQAQSLYFLDNFWRNGTSVSGTFRSVFEASGKKFASDNEKHAFVQAVNILIDSLDPNRDIYGAVRTQLDEIKTR